MKNREFAFGDLNVMGMWLTQDYIQKIGDLQDWIKEILGNGFYKLKVR
jgi:hypothetical protein